MVKHTFKNKVEAVVYNKAVLPKNLNFLAYNKLNKKHSLKSFTESGCPDQFRKVPRKSVEK